MRPKPVLTPPPLKQRAWESPLPLGESVAFQGLSCGLISGDMILSEIT